MESKKTTLVIGAGSTLSDGARRPLAKRPPLDKGFFSVCERLGSEHYPTVKHYLESTYGIDPTDASHDSLESMMAIIYADLSSPKLKDSATEAFRSLIRLFSRRLAETTNSLDISNRGNLYRILTKLLTSGVKPEDISIITFNQDLQIEKALERLSNTRKYQKFGTLFSFPSCYRLTKASQKLTNPGQSVPKFKTNSSDVGIAIYKLHGSLNWFSIHNSPSMPTRAILNPDRSLRITPRRELLMDLRFTAGKKTNHTFPLIIPPVNHKASIIHTDLHPLWEKAESALENSEQVIVFGYSCPPSDFESANLLRRAAGSGEDPETLSVIDPNPETFQRYVDVTALNHLSFFRSAEAYLEKG